MEAIAFLLAGAGWLAFVAAVFGGFQFILGLTPTPKMRRIKRIK